MKRATIINYALVAISIGTAVAQNQAINPRSIGDGPVILKPPVEIPSGTVPPACVPFLKMRGGASALINCYLNDPSNQNIAWAISWGFNNQYTPWAQ